VAYTIHSTMLVSIMKTLLGVSLSLTATTIEAFTTIHPIEYKYRTQEHNSLLFTTDSSDDPISRLPLMEAELLSETDEEKRQLLMDSISDAKTGGEFGVRSAQFRFYEAFSNQDVTLMKDVWSTNKDIRCIHPGMQSLNGPEAVHDSWQQIFKGNAFTIQPKRTQIDISGQTALCSCIEETPDGGLLECLNIYKRENASWKMILHMASPIVMVQRTPPTAPME